MTAAVARTADLPWQAAVNRDASAEQVQGVETKILFEGVGGIHAKEARFPAGKVVTPHHHSIDEFIYVLDGSCTLDDGTALSAGDAVVLQKLNAYGFEVGPDGMRFLLIRPGDARLTPVDSSS